MQNLPSLITGEQKWRSLCAAPHGAEPSGESCSRWGPAPTSPGFSLDLLIVLQKERGCRGVKENDREAGSSYHRTCRGFLGGAVMKNLPASAEDVGDDGSIPESGRSPGGRNGNPLQYSCLNNPMDRETWRATVHGVAELDTCIHVPRLKNRWTRPRPILCYISSKVTIISLHQVALRRTQEVIYQVHFSLFLLLLFSHSVVSYSLWPWPRPRGLQHASLPCPSPSPEACSNSRPLTR